MSIGTTIVISFGMILISILVVFGITCKKEIELKKLEIHSKEAKYD